MPDAKISVTFEEDHDRLEALLRRFKRRSAMTFRRPKRRSPRLSLGDSATSCGRKIFFSPSGRRIQAWRRVARRRSCGRSID